jgi:hypothetical protein
MALFQLLIFRHCVPQTGIIALECKAMKSTKHELSLIFLSVNLAISVFAQGATPQSSARERAADLRRQLSDVEAKQAELQARLQQIEENLKPENIERSFAGVGSTRPEELREQRRRQLEIERTGARSQLDLLATSHSRLETAILQADGEAYRQSANGVTSGPSQTASGQEADTPAVVRRSRRLKRSRAKKQRRATTHKTTGLALPRNRAVLAC